MSHVTSSARQGNITFECGHSPDLLLAHQPLWLEVGSDLSLPYLYTSIISHRPLWLYHLSGKTQGPQLPLAATLAYRGATMGKVFRTTFRVEIYCTPFSKTSETFPLDFNV